MGLASKLATRFSGKKEKEGPSDADQAWKALSAYLNVPEGKEGEARDALAFYLDTQRSED